MVLYKETYIKSYEEFRDFIEKVDANSENLYLYFTGSKLPSGESWCPDCVEAWPVVTKEISQASNDIELVIVEVGNRETWKDPKCSYRVDPLTKLMVIPTLKKWNSPKKLEGEQCSKPELVSMIFDVDDA